jgi:uncharacterized protein YjbI with pentapeptide repeats
MNSAPQPPDFSPTPSSLADLEKAFQVLTSIENPLVREYELILQAKQFNLDVETYQRLFDTYGQQIQADESEDLLKPLKLADRTLGDFVRQFESLSLLQLANLMGQLTLLLALVSYVVEAPKRYQQAINTARNTVYERSDQPFSDGRQEAFEFLNRNCIAIVGFSAEKAALPGIQMNQCYRWQWNRQSLLRFPPQLRRYEGANLSHLNLKGANLQGANLAEANFSNSDLSEAN